MFTKSIFLLILLVWALDGLSQSNASSKQVSGPNEVGIVYSKHYPPKVYGGAFQNWGGLQNKDGVMFFCNTDGVLVYDGKTWSVVRTPVQGVIRSLGLTDDGRIYVGSLDDFGYLDKQSDGHFEYVSLQKHIKPENQSMGNVWQTLVLGNTVYFETETGLYQWDGKRVQVWPWPDQNAYHVCFVWKDKIYLQEIGKGLMTLEGDQFVMAPGGEYFKDVRIYNVLGISADRLQVATQYDGLFHYDGAASKRFPTDADKFFAANQIYCGAALSDSLFVYGTRLGGAVTIDSEGGIRNLINNKTGLPTNIALGLTVDRDGNLWFSLDNGISRYELAHGMSIFDIRNGLEGAINSFCRFNGKLYVATNSGLFVLKPGSFPKQPPTFEKVRGITRSCFRLFAVKDRMVISSNDGLFEMVGDDVSMIIPDAVYAIHQFRGDSDRIVVGLSDQFKMFTLRNGKWRAAGTIDDVKIDVVDFQENFDGRVWVSSYSQGAALITFPLQNGMPDYDSPTVRNFGPADGLPEGSVTVNWIADQEIFQVGSEPRFFKFDYDRARFEEDSLFVRRLGLSDKNIFPITDQDASGNFFFRTMPDDEKRQEVILMSRSGDGSFISDRYDISRISEHVHIHFYHEKNVFWFGGADGILRYEIPQSNKSPKKFETYINKIILGRDSLFFQGTGDVQQNLTFAYKTNSLRFEFTSNNFSAEERNEFQYKLEGYDDTWSDWTTENIKEYPRLWEGTYTFQVRSRDYAHQVGQVDKFTFSIAAPWFRSFYAYAVYFIAVAIFVWAVVRWRLQAVLKEKEALQREIALQTQEIRQQNARLEEQSEELKVNAEQLKELDKMKSNFFVNISHEFRTPLSLILSPLEKVIHDKEPNKIRMTEVERMHRNAKRLQQLINQLLDLAKLESGGMKLNLQQSDFLYFIRVMVSSFESLAESRNIQFDLQIPTGSYHTFFDLDKVETVLYNLLSNAFKFTPDNGRVSVKVDLPSPEGELGRITVSDTGPGIPSSELDKIFDRFYQVDSSTSREYEGSGVGLSLVKELVELMNGKIKAASGEAGGAIFTVQLPLQGKLAALDENELALASDAQTHRQTAEDLEPTIFDESLPATMPLVLVVEDNPDLRAYLTENLEEEYRVAIAENGQIGLDKALELAPDLIISDMMMPVMDGFMLCTKIRSDERTSHIPFVLLTARSTIESKLEGLELGADDYIIKPFNIKELNIRLKNLLEQRKQLRKSFSREVTVQPKNISITSVDERFLNHALEIMETHLSDEQFSVERFAEEMGMSRKNLLRKIKALTDQSVNEFIRNFRLQRAAQMLSANSATVSEIAYQVGFNNLSYFSKCFKELYGVVPNEYNQKSA